MEPYDDTYEELSDTDGKDYKVTSKITHFGRYETTTPEDWEFTYQPIKKSSSKGIEGKGLIEALWDIFGETITKKVIRYKRK